MIILSSPTKLTLLWNINLLFILIYPPRRAQNTTHPAVEYLFIIYCDNSPCRENIYLLLLFSSPIKLTLPWKHLFLLLLFFPIQPNPNSPCRESINLLFIIYSFPTASHHKHLTRCPWTETYLDDPASPRVSGSALSLSLCVCVCGECW